MNKISESFSFFSLCGAAVPVSTCSLSWETWARGSLAIMAAVYPLRCFAGEASLEEFFTRVHNIAQDFHHLVEVRKRVPQYHHWWVVPRVQVVRVRLENLMQEMVDTIGEAVNNTRTYGWAASLCNEINFWVALTLAEEDD